MVIFTSDKSGARLAGLGAIGRDGGRTIDGLVQSDLWRVCQIPSVI
jgi:hypothetical protein